jgi:hypothetical protein
VNENLDLDLKLVGRRISDEIMIVRCDGAADGARGSEHKEAKLGVEPDMLLCSHHGLLVQGATLSTAVSSPFLALIGHKQTFDRHGTYIWVNPVSLL